MLPFLLWDEGGGVPIEDCRLVIADLPDYFVARSHSLFPFPNSNPVLGTRYPVPFPPMTFLADSKAWAKGRSPYWRLVILAVLGWDGLRHLRDPDAGGLFAGITFGVHELGHLIFAFFGEFMAVAGGSLNQLLIPVGAGLLLYYYEDFFGIAAAGAWLSSSLLDLARYVADSRVFELDLIGFGGDPEHDWAYLLGRFNVLQYDTRIAAGLRILALVGLLLSLGYGLWLCLSMKRPGEGPLDESVSGRTSSGG